MKDIESLPRKNEPDVRAQRGDLLHWLRHEVDRLFDDAGRPGRLFDWPMLRAAQWPPIEIRARNGSYHVTMDVPGFHAEDISVRVDGDTLVVRGARSDNRERDEDGMIVSERHQGQFERRIALPGKVKPDGCKAELKRGVLKLELSRAEDADGTTIPVKGAD